MESKDRALPPRASNNFDLLRLSLAVAVVFSHSFALGDGDNQKEPLFTITSGQSTIGEVAVDCFFVISGFLITQSWDRSQSCWSYLNKRLCRIYPGFILVAILDTYLVGYIAGAVSYPSPWRFIYETIWLQADNPEGVFSKNAFSGSVNGSLWSIPYEFWCYLGVMLLGWTRILKSKYTILILFLLSLVPSFVFSFFELQWVGGGIAGQIFGWPMLWSRLLPFFLAGITLYKFKDVLPLNGWGACLSLVILVLLSSVYHSWRVALPIFASYLIFFIAFQPKMRLSFLGRFGDCSYGLYLYAFPIQQLVVMFLGTQRDGRVFMNPIQLFLISCPLSIVAGYASWHLVEKHFMKRPERKPLYCKGANPRGSHNQMEVIR